jgi:hypothetical protein
MAANDQSPTGLISPGEKVMKERTPPRSPEPESPRPKAKKTRQSPDITGKAATGHAPALLDLLWLGVDEQETSP